MIRRQPRAQVPANFLRAQPLHPASPHFGHHAARPSPTESAGRAAVHPAAPPLVGRQRELTALRDALTAALAGRGALVLIGGEAGIGKTTLAETLLAEATGRGALALVGRCYDLSETPPFGPWTEILVRVPRADGLPPAPDPAAGAASRLALFARVRGYLAALAERQPLVLLLDDLHWSDPASLDLLLDLGHRVAELPLLLLVTYRSDVVERDNPFYATLARLVRETPALRLAPAPLGDGDLAALLRRRYPLAPGDEARLIAYLTGRSDGNPFYAIELLRALEETGTVRASPGGWQLGDLGTARVPAMLRQIITARVAQLGTGARDALAAAAVIGQEVPWELWASVSGHDETTLVDVAERALDARLLCESGDESILGFCHELVREALYERLAPPRRRLLHRRAGEALAATATSDPDAVAHHFRRAGDLRAIEWLARAGDRAQRAWAYDTAAARFGTAAEVAERLAGWGREAGWLRYRLAVLSLAADPARALDALEVAVRAGEAADDDALVAHARFFRGMIHLDATDLRRGVADGLAELAAGVAALEALPERGPIRLTALGDFVAVPSVYDEHNPAGALVLYLAQSGHYTAALARGEANVAEMPPAATGMGRAAYGDAYLGLALAHAAQGRPDEARRAFVQARDAYGAINHQQQIAIALWSELTALWLPYRADRPAERAALVADAQAASTRAGGIYDPATGRLRHLPALFHDGAWDAIRRLAPAVVAAGRPETYVLGQLARAEGDLARAWAMVRDHLPENYDTAPGEGHFARGLLVIELASGLALDAADLPTAAAWLDAHDRWLDWNGAVTGRAAGALGWAEYHRAAGDLAEARAHAERSRAHATEPRQPLALLAAHRLLGELAIEAGDHAGAAAHLATSLRLADACAAPYERALTLLALARLHASTGAREQARVALETARAILESLGAAAALARAAALASGTLAQNPPARRDLPPDSAAPDRSRAPLPFGLSAREAEVLRLVAEGLANDAVAARLSLSRRTVEQHLRSVYNKLGVDNRTAAAHLAHRHGLA